MSDAAGVEVSDWRFHRSTRTICGPDDDASQPWARVDPQDALVLWWDRLRCVSKGNGAIERSLQYLWNRPHPVSDREKELARRAYRLLQGDVSALTTQDLDDLYDMLLEPGVSLPRMTELPNPRSHASEVVSLFVCDRTDTLRPVTQWMPSLVVPSRGGRPTADDDRRQARQKRKIQEQILNMGVVLSQNLEDAVQEKIVAERQERLAQQLLESSRLRGSPPSSSATRAAAHTLVQACKRKYHRNALGDARWVDENSLWVAM